MNKPMDQIINWFMLLIIFVFDPLAIGMVVAANMAFAKLKPKNKKDYFKSRNKELERKVECSVPDGKKFGVWYPIPKEDSGSIDITDEDENRMNIIGQNGNDGLHYKEDKKNEVIKKEVIREYIKLPRMFKQPLSEAAKHMRRKGIKVPNTDQFFEN
jgi:hypothetical protein